MAVDKSLVIWSFNNKYKLLHTNTHVVALTNAVCVLTIRLFIMYNDSLLFFLSRSNFIPATCFSTTAQKLKFFIKDSSHLQKKSSMENFTEEILNGKLHFMCSISCFIRCRLIYFSEGGKLEMLITVPLFSDFSIMSVFKFLCCIMLKILILLLRIYTVITFCESVICIYNCHILYFSLLPNYLCQCGFVNCIII